MSEKFIVVNATQESMPINDSKEIEAAINALIACDEHSARVYVGHPEDPDSYWNGMTLRVPAAEK
jgi:hypothetical protein